MNRYGPDFRLDSSSHTFDLGQFSEVEWVGTLAAIGQTERIQVFNLGIGGTFVSCPALHDGVIYIGCCDKNVYASDADTGREIWRFATDGPITGSARIHDGVLYIGSYDGSLYALTLGGQLKWKYFANAKIYSTPEIANGLVVFGGEDGIVHAVSPNGEKAWRFRAAEAICSDPWYDRKTNRVLFSSFDHNLYAVHASTGQEAWRFSGKMMMGSPIVHEDRIYVSNYDGNLYVLNLEGELQWRYTLDDQIQPSRPAIWNDTIYFVARHGVLHAIGLDGKPHWKFSTSNLLFASPTIADGVLYMGACEGVFYALDARSGAVRWKLSTQSNVPIISKAAVFGDKVIFGSQECKVRALTLEGHEAWDFPASISTPAPIDVEPPSRLRQTEQVVEIKSRSEEKDRYRMEGGVADQFGPKSSYVIKSQYTEKSMYTNEKRE